MLHTESAFEMNYGLESSHLDAARSSLRRLLDSSGRDPAARDFAARWHALTAMLYCTRNDARQARLEINRGLRFDADHKYGNLVAGALDEYEMSVSAPRKARDANLATVKRPSLSYRMIVSKYPDFFEARLRFSRELNDQKAREQLDIVVARATSPDVLYLAHMFLARLHERANRAGDAEREYEARARSRPIRQRSSRSFESPPCAARTTGPVAGCGDSHDGGSRTRGPVELLELVCHGRRSVRRTSG